ncbi:hypothetical protein Tco_1170454 [Tanacetum coccineum]
MFMPPSLSPQHHHHNSHPLRCRTSPTTSITPPLPPSTPSTPPAAATPHLRNHHLHRGLLYSRVHHLQQQPPVTTASARHQSPPPHHHTDDRVLVSGVKTAIKGCLDMGLRQPIRARLVRCLTAPKGAFGTAAPIRGVFGFAIFC